MYYEKLTVDQANVVDDAIKFYGKLRSDEALRQREAVARLLIQAQK